ncbi:flagellin [Clostridium sp. JS66]|uniref:flagellin N-terminal helical domain-containing protein n=1 Tax=Clostridium sp. JS66 TaxID=3064705 RepID=UPI00298E68E2|nr:flagellin [Clostridium sp. JS66]WPC40214.1 flagellin [Clostridium sp. JS66]
MIIRYNSAANKAINNKKKNTNALEKLSEKLASGLRINRAADDAAGLSISQKMEAQVRGLNSATDNGSNSISLIQTAEGAMNSMHSILQRVRELSIQAANGTLVQSDRENIGDEMSELGHQLDNIVDNTEFNTKKLFIGVNETLNFQIGANEGQIINLTIDKSKLPTSFFLFSGARQYNVAGEPCADLSLQNNATTILKNTDKYIGLVSQQRSNLGAIQNKLEHSISYTQMASENLTQANSRIGDEDMTSGMMEYVKTQILDQATMSLLKQANSQPEMVLMLLK